MGDDVEADETVAAAAVFQYEEYELGTMVGRYLLKSPLRGDRAC